MNPLVGVDQRRRAFPRCGDDNSAQALAGVVETASADWAIDPSESVLSWRRVLMMGAIELGADVESPRRARSFVTKELLEAGVDPAIIADAALLTNELVTNAVIHARTEMLLTVAIEADHVRVSVTDHSTEGEPVLRNPRADEATGRGLFMVDSLASDWDIATGEGGTTVTFRLETQRIGQNQ